jgi:4-amino-4-deoxy-L-arabinose transferase-like glycosyltransferase
MVLLVFWMGVRLFHRPRAALIAAFGYAIAIPVARYANIPHVDIWAIDLNIVGAALFVGAVDAERKWPWLVGVGLVAGAGLWFRPVIGWFLMAVALAFWVGWREALKLVVVPILVAAVVITPWFVRNYNDFHRVVYRTGTGQGTWEGLGQLRNDFGARWSDSAANQTVRRERPDIKYGTVQFDDYLRKKSIHAIKTHPGFYAKLLAWRAYRALWYAHSPWRWAYPGVPSSAYRGSSPADVAHYFSADPGNATIYYATFVLKVPATLLFLAVIPTLVLARRRYGRQLAMLLAVMLGTFLPYWLFDVEPEYALPASFAYVLVGALGIDLAIEGRVWERLRRPRRKLAAAESV